MIFEQELFYLLAKKATIITPNDRLAKEITKAYFHQQSSLTVVKPHCYSYQQFLQNWYLQQNIKSPNLPILLQDFQCQHLWREVIGFNTNQGLLEEVHKAWEITKQWEIDINCSVFSSSAQASNFQSWAQDFEKKLASISAIAAPQIAANLLTQPFYLPSSIIVWFGFDSFTPIQQKLQLFFQNNDCEVLIKDVRAVRSQSSVYSAKDEKDEEEKLIQWLTHCCSQSGSTIAVIFFDLEQKKQHLQRLFMQHLPNIVFNFSYGETLNQYSLINIAWIALTLDGKALTAEDARTLLVSAFLAFSESEFLERAEAEANCPALQEPVIDYYNFAIYLIDKAPQLGLMLVNITIFPESAPTVVWPNLFIQRLKNLGFPGERALNSTNFQCYQRLLNMFDQFYELSLIQQHMSKDLALTTLDNLLKSTIFQPQSVKTQVQVLGYLEALGSPFDYVWVGGMTETAFPAKMRINSFIPLTLQRQKNLPHVSPDMQLSIAEKTFQRLNSTMGSIIYSYPKLYKEQHNLAHPLLKNVPAYHALGNSVYSPLSHLEWHPETHIIPFSATSVKKGGSSLIANQAKCPFRAFALHRLHAYAMEEQTAGLNLRQRGQIIHKILELIWQQLQCQTNLLALNDAELDCIIENAITIALQPYIAERSQSFSTIFQAIENKRLHQIIHAFLAAEKLRPNFTIEAIEKTFTYQLADILITLRVDRMDKELAGHKWVIDYKTSIPGSMPWFEERPKEPQMLLYALLDDAINTLLFVSFKSGAIVNKGFAEHRESLAANKQLTIENDWLARRQLWQENLEMLAEEFSHGHCLPQPLTSSVCQSCELKSLCRFHYTETKSNLVYE